MNGGIKSGAIFKRFYSCHQNSIWNPQNKTQVIDLSILFVLFYYIQMCIMQVLESKGNLVFRLLQNDA